jgi:hypothetical protein
MWEVLGNIIKLVLFIMTWRIGTSQEKKAEKSAFAKEASDAVASGSISRINLIVAKLRNQG